MLPMREATPGLATLSGRTTSRSASDQAATRLENFIGWLETYLELHNLHRASILDTSMQRGHLLHHRRAERLMGTAELKSCLFEQVVREES